MTKKIITEYINVDDCWEGPLIDLRKQINDRIAHVLGCNGWERVGNDCELDCEYYGYDNGRTLQVWIKRYETDVEYDTRINEEQKSKLKTKQKVLERQEKELKELERLAKKFKKKLV